MIVCDENGHVVKDGTADDVFTNPSEAYTRELLSALPTLERPAATRADSAPER